VGGRLGDIVHSSPLFVGPPVQIDRSTEPYPQGDDAYSSFKVSHTNRSGVVYVAANDGMLHGFQADCNKEPSDSPPCAAAGEELFGYLPNNLILGGYSRNITGLLDPAYSHKFFVDLTPSVNDVFIDTGGSPGGRQWTTMLMGGHGAGGKAYFALDVTDPDLLTESNADKVVLWEFTDEDDSYPTVDGFPVTTSNGDQREDRGSPSKPVKDLGYAFSIPTIAMSNVKVLDASGENEWIAIFGNGYNSTAGIAKLFVLFVGRGVDGDWCHPDKIYNEGLINGSLPTGCVTGEQDFLKLDTTYGALPEVRDQDNNYVSGGLPNGLGTPRGIDIDGNGTLDYAYAGDTQGNFFRFDLSSSVYAEWNVTRIFKAAYAGVDQPITTRPIVTRHPTEPDGFIVIFSSGSYVSISDGYNTDVQSIYGIWDRLIENDFTNLAEMVRQNYTNVNSSTFGSVRTLSNHSVDYSAATPENPDGGKKGWFNHLDLPAAESVGSEAEFPGERAIRNIQLRGGFVFVNSVIPRSDQSCVDISGGFPLSFCPGTGGTDCFGDQGVFDLNNDGKFDVDDEVGGDVVAGGPMFESVPADSVFIGDKRITQLSNKEISIMSTNTGSGRYTGRLSWKQLDAIY
jgi:type IV pilus assembly protein PilY1